ncbi:MAG: hypothetical protein Q4E60_10805, partial [Bacteroidales bacterium]|nr:hypothetical protein [Bacteroidales bacterium]
MKKHMLTRAMSYMMAFLVAVSSIQLPVYAEEIVVQEENTDFEVEEVEDEDVNDVAIGDESKLEEDETVEEVELDLFNQPEFYELEEELELLNQPELYGLAEESETITVTTSLDPETYTVTATWTPVAGATKYTVYLMHKEKNSEAFNQEGFAVGVPATGERIRIFYPANFAHASNGDTDIWRVEVYAFGAVGEGLGGGTSDTFSTGIPTLAAPKSVIFSGDRTFYWDAVPGADNYSFELYGRVKGKWGSGTKISYGTSSNTSVKFTKSDMVDGYEYRCSVYAWDSMWLHQKSEEVWSDWFVMGQTKTLIRGYNFMGTIESGDTLNDDDPLYLNTWAGIDYAYFTYYRNGVYQSENTKATFGNYDCTVCLGAKEGYEFTKDSIMYYNEVEIRPSMVLEDGSAAWYDFPTFSIECSHSSGVWGYSSTEHWKICSDCKGKYEVGSHNFIQDISGDTITFTCECGFSKTGKVAKTSTGIYFVNIDFGTVMVGDEIPTTVKLDYANPTLGSDKYYNYATVQSVEYTQTGTIFANELTGVTVVLKANEDYYFEPGAMPRPVSSCYAQYNRQSYEVSEEGKILTAYFTFTPYAFADVTLTLPEFMVGKTYTEIAKDTVFTINGVECSDYSISIKKLDDSSVVFGEIEGGISNSDLNNYTILPDTEYEFKASVELGSNYGRKFTITNPTIATLTDSYCGELMARATFLYESSGKHVWGEGVVTKAATCTEDGIMTFTCQDCTAERTVVILATGHSAVDISEVPPTCTQDGTSAGKICLKCQTVLSGCEVLSATGVHNFEWVIDKPATTTEVGSKHEECTVCRYAKEAVTIEKLPFKAGLWFENIPDQTYTGAAIKPVLDVYCDGVLLTAGKDYTITYGKYNTNVAAKDAMSKGKSVAPSVTITGKGNYSEKKTMNFAIVPCSVGTATVNDMLVAKTGKNIKITPTVKVNGRTLKLGTDYVVSTTTDISGEITSLKYLGQYDLYVVGKNNYTGYASFKFTITEKTLASKVTIGKIADQKYDGGNQVKPVPSITYKIGGKSTDVSSHFDVTYDNNTEIGTATVTIKAKSESDFVGTKTATFKITGTQISGAKLGVDGKGTIPSRVYDGTAYEPALDLYVGSTPLTYGIDYEVTYTNNVKVGTATATVVGKGKYTGSKKFTYKISKYDAEADTSSFIKVNGVDASNVDISVNYEKGGVLYKPVVTMNGIVLKEKTDYTLSYANNNAVAAKDAMKNGKSIAPTMTITFKGNLSGKKT